MITQQEYKQRRQTFMGKMGTQSIAIICTNHEHSRTQDISFPFRPNGNFYYLTGFDEADCIAVFIPGRTEGEFILFNLPRDASREIWNGPRAGQEGALKNFGADQAFPVEEFSNMLPDLLLGKKTALYQIGFENGIDELLVRCLNKFRDQSRTGTIFPTEMIDATTIINEMRAIKTPAEIAIMRKAAQINVAAHQRMMQTCTAGMSEIQLASEGTYIYGQNNCTELAYQSIVATGTNACILHYRAGNRILKNGELVLIDMGEEYEWYASDVTRTFPVNGKFSPEQKQIYELVLSIQLVIIEMIKPGVPFDSLQEVTIRLMTEGFVTLGLLKGNVADLIANKAYFDFYMHRVSHWIGLDAHDVAAYKVNGQWRPLQAGMALTVEPGIYISPDNKNVEARWRGIGIRIEDDLVVTETGCENLTGAAPKTVAEIEAVMSK
ncbi:MAG: M24 family metallopeptidase [Gammaproteobacteria bacterium]|nr:M24 family metallopeptidase [Gammaproteobacteria bacterium]